MLSGLYGPYSGDTTMLALFQDEALVDGAIRYEQALTLACAQAGLISRQDADVIIEVIDELEINPAGIVNEAKHAGTLAIPLVQKLRGAVSEVAPATANAVHLGSTSQDVIDTVMVMQCVKASELLAIAGNKLCGALVELAVQHAQTPMLGRTLLRGALPITFGLKVCNWLAGVEDGLQRVSADAEKLSVQFGGPVGTLSGLAGKGTEVAAHLASVLDLPSPGLPWQVQRNQPVSLACSLGIVGGATKKIAHDIVLLGQDEIAEVFEAGVTGRGGSSAMSHKRNPTGAQQTLTGLQRIPGLAQAMLAGMDVEHERGVSGWQAEFGILAEMYVGCYDAIVLLAGIIEGLEVDPQAMHRNLVNANVGDDVGEVVMLVHKTIAKISNE